MPAKDGFLILGPRVRKVSVAFYLLDDLTGGPADNVVVHVDRTGLRPIRNPSGYHVFVDLPEGRYEFTIDGGDYRPMAEMLDLKEDETPYVLVRRVVPVPGYEFPTGTTLLRGTVLETATDHPLSGVSVHLSVFGGSKTALTTADGRFVLYANELNEKRTARRNGMIVVADDDRNTEFSPTFAKDGYRDETGTIVVMRDGMDEERRTLFWEVGRTTTIRKYLTRGV